MLAVSARAARSASRALSTKTVTVINGSGIGPEIMNSTIEAIKATGADLTFEEVSLPVAEFEKTGKTVIPEDVIATIKKNKVALMAPQFTPFEEESYTSAGIELRNALGLTTYVTAAKNFEGTKTHRHEDVDMLIVRENVMGPYLNLDMEPVEGIVQGIAIHTAESFESISRAAFALAASEGRKKVSAIHKANIIKKADGMFLAAFRKVAAEYPSMETEEMIIDNTCMQLVSRPQQFDVMVMPNFYGSIVGNVAAGVVGSPGITSGANVGAEVAIYEQGARHVAEDIAGKNQANPAGLMLAGADMLIKVGEQKKGAALKAAIAAAVKSNPTKDVGGAASTTEFTAAVVANLA